MNGVVVVLVVVPVPITPGCGRDEEEADKACVLPKHTVADAGVITGATG